MLLDKNEALLCVKIPADLLPTWIKYCRRCGYTQSRIIRMAIADSIYKDPHASNAELAMAARIDEFGYGYDPRGVPEQPNDGGEEKKAE